MKTESIIPVYTLQNFAGDGTGFIIGHNQCSVQPVHPGTPHRHDNYTIELLLSGSMTLQLDFDVHKVEAPAIILIAPDQVHLHDRESDYELLSISFSKEYVDQEVENMLACWECVFSNNAVAVTQEEIEELNTYAKLMFMEYKNNRLQKDMVIQNLLTAFIVCCIRMVQKDMPEYCETEIRENSMVREFRELVDRHYNERTQVAQYAEMLFVTPGHLNDTIKSLTGRTAKQIIDSKRILEAKRLLYWGRHSVKEIAWQLNFEDDAYFNRYFKKHTGTTPALYQRVSSISTTNPLIR